MASQPVILVTSDHTFSAPNMYTAPIYALDKSYTNAVSEAGGLPVTPLGPGMEREYSELADGLLLTGGLHIHPGRYHTPIAFDDSPVTTNFYRDTMEFDLFRAFYAAGKPIFGIGRGHQLINVALGGTLHQDLRRSHGLDYAQGKKETLTALPDSVLFKLFGAEPTVWLQHTQAVGKLGAGLKATSYTADGIVESLEHAERPILSVQFHPELLADKAERLRLFEYFLKMG
ncbi:gamma-glutamyl-gamma-aminobutyrate hydrolase family protein [Cohnella hongkongensis]|uniref:Gamma-glutamyl-gamma-aminobutyrate hydrolase family protein n=1 Tax=Cohnella hongkongensis TaxID=178337 RepID=A0ABV9F531_9BACL